MEMKDNKEVLKDIHNELKILYEIQKDMAKNFYSTHQENVRIEKQINKLISLREKITLNEKQNIN